MIGFRRWPVLEDNPVLTNRGWLPPAEECPELADLRAEHERLLAARAEALETVSALIRQQEDEEQTRGRAMTDAMLAGESEPKNIKPKVTDEDLKEARLRFEATSDALQEFAKSALANVREQAPKLYAGLTDRNREAEAKRLEARELLAEADRLAASPKRLRDWVDRCTGESPLGLVVFESLALPVRQPTPRLFEELAGLGPGEVAEIGSDEIVPGEVMVNA